ncbi:hypothetical protein PF005_g15952 [Phytophthora fragariae]|uniref:Uncharacterized protein n=1 Tax=Phytophthora fragariae TaxID=53985 RepID=A0A6A3JBG9_9STRA|nr:hypothetical protein PF009_g20305 [Phytophthora fragariae]KAE8990758.1 hypothetical protein PF011_g18220 [Phytophthora fragariae]KAE9089856.1 hypothetical protein PF007_g19456 [Phytophthora fragariae]KAE9098376.1 hypothetical protein PF010_g15584 [Phytophthora fragariae]KAE9134089.1 hypothetical protein PF006_g14898 [Phytophthora fragariae]
MCLEYSSSERPKTNKLALSEALIGTKSLQSKPTPRKVKTSKTSSKHEAEDGGATRTSKLHRRKSPGAVKGATESPSYPRHTSQSGGYQLCALQRMFC